MDWGREGRWRGGVRLMVVIAGVSKDAVVQRGSVQQQRRRSGGGVVLVALLIHAGQMFRAQVQRTRRTVWRGALAAWRVRLALHGTLTRQAGLAAATDRERRGGGAALTQLPRRPRPASFATPRRSSP